MRMPELPKESFLDLADAMRQWLTVTGLLGFVVLAKQRKLVAEIVPVIHELQDKGRCWFGHKLLCEVCRSVGETWE